VAAAGAPSAPVPAGDGETTKVERAATPMASDDDDTAAQAVQPPAPEQGERPPPARDAGEVGVADVLGAALSNTNGQARTRPGTVLRVPVPNRRQRQAARRLQARKVGRLVRHLDLWSLMKIALMFYAASLVVAMVAGTLLWTVLQRSGAVGSVEDFIKEAFALESFNFDGPLIFRLGVFGGMVAVLLATLVTVLLGLMFNLISDLTGGLRVSVVEEETTRPAPPRRR
jgi:hypothetical protein